MITCRHFTEFLMDFLSGALRPAEQALFESHLSICPACRSYLHSYRETVRLGRQAFDPDDGPVPAEVPEELVQAILRARPLRG
jgi:anti-sigma factor RsiW